MIPSTVAVPELLFVIVTVAVIEPFGAVAVLLDNDMEAVTLTERSSSAG